MMDVLSTLTLEELNNVIQSAQALIEAKKNDQRRDEIVAEMEDLLAELDELGFMCYFGTPARKGGLDCFVVVGKVSVDHDVVIIT